MAFDEYLAERINRILNDKKVHFTSKKMMGGLCYLVNDKMLVGIVKNELMARIGEDAYSKALKKEGCKEMNFTGRPMKGYVFVEPQAIDMDHDLSYWVDLALEHNPYAKATKKKK